MLSEFKQTDLIRRTFLKPIGDIMVPYHYTTHAGIFNRHPEDDSTLKALLGYLAEVFLGGAQYKALGCSDSAILIGIKSDKINDSELMWNCLKSEACGKGKQQHEICQNYLMANDPTCIAMEIPVWSETESRSGFIDLLRIRDGKIEILDYKPRPSHLQTEKVLSQLLRYKQLLQEQLQCDPDKIVCRWFNDEGVWELIY